MLAAMLQTGLTKGYMTAKNTSITTIADWFLTKEAMTHKKLQKLCYYAVAWGWALMDRSIAKNDNFEAWVHGPVSPTLYKKYKGNGWNAIPKLEAEVEIPVDINELLESVWATYGEKDGNELEALSHIEAPWISARKGLAESHKGFTLMEPEEMKSYYLSIYKGDDK